VSDAEMQRRVELESALAEALERLETGDAAGARSVLAAALRTARAPQPAARGAQLPDISESEFEQAFEDASPETENMLHADQVARAAMREADRALVSEVRAGDEVAPSFATETMAELLERQGDEAGASRIRASLERAPAETPARPGREQVISTLERWLENIRGGARA
jgi:hypothetical protein